MTSPAQKHHRGTYTVLLVVLLLTASILLVWGHYKPMDQDEIFVLQTDSVPSVRALVEVQRHYPISLDPLFYHLLVHASLRLFGGGTFALRLPSLLGYLLMQVCLFGIARAIAGARTGTIAAAVPALTATVFYGVEARPYGVLLGLAALMLLAWQASVRRTARRWIPLLTLTVALALALNTHYFAVLLLIPLYAAELFRQARQCLAVRAWKIDGAMLMAVAAGTAGVAFAVPFQKAAGEFRTHYYNAGRVGLHAVTQSYRALFLDYTALPTGLQRVLAMLLVVLAVTLVWAVRAALRRGPRVLPAELVYLCVLASLPLFGFLLARYVTHAIEVRYVLPAIVAFALLIALALQPLLRTAGSYAVTTCVLLIAVAAAGAMRVADAREKRAAMLATLADTPQLRAQLQGTKDAHIYVQNLGFFDEMMPYAPQETRSRMVLLYSREQELRWLHHDTGALTALHMQHFTQVPIVSYEELQRQPGRHLLLRHPDGWEWMGRALDASHVPSEALGHALGGELTAINFGGGPR